LAITLGQMKLSESYLYGFVEKCFLYKIIEKLLKNLFLNPSYAAPSV
jgi:hypothetical protein